jgi:predicted metalloendopeptidase
MLELAGTAKDKAEQDADKVIRLETELAKVSLTRIELRDPVKNYNKMNLADLRSWLRESTGRHFSPEWA